MPKRYGGAKVAPKTAVDSCETLNPLRPNCLTGNEQKRMSKSPCHFSTLRYCKCSVTSKRASILGSTFETLGFFAEVGECGAANHEAAGAARGYAFATSIGYGSAGIDVLRHNTHA